MRSVAALVLVGMLILWAELPTGSAWSCPPVRIVCAMHNPPNQCNSNWDCPMFRKCCPTYCGRKCIRKPSRGPIHV
ncbi:caltrin-like protein 2 [Manacus vitellinus]|uniref:caltrin-like protein 2 n=1 Tax=Manacus vitellinus TaxID=328815 RepID=UPI0008463203|nr:caltrin-like protein 2 [Manacus vitellinus]